MIRMPAAWQSRPRRQPRGAAGRAAPRARGSTARVRRPHGPRARRRPEASGAPRREHGDPAPRSASMRRRIASRSPAARARSELSPAPIASQRPRTSSGAPLSVHAQSALLLVDGRHDPQRRVEAEMPPAVAPRARTKTCPRRAPPRPAGARPRSDRRARRRIAVELGVRARRNAVRASSCAGPSDAARQPVQGELAGRRPDCDRLHPVLGQRPGLVGADDRRGTERLDGAQPLHQRAARASARTPTASASVIVGRSPSGTLADDQPDREGERVAERKARCESAEREEHEAGGHRHPRDQPGDPFDLRLQRALFALNALRQRRDPSELRAHSRCEDDASRLAARAGASR